MEKDKECPGMIREWEKLTGKDWEEVHGSSKRAPTVKHNFRCVNCGKKLRPQWNSKKTKLEGFGIHNLLCSKTCAVGYVLNSMTYTHININRWVDKYNNEKDD